jgi:hypothetical protein
MATCGFVDSTTRTDVIRSAADERPEWFDYMPENRGKIVIVRTEVVAATERTTNVC